MQLHLEVTSTVYIMYTHIYIFTFSPYQSYFIDWNLCSPFHLIKDTSLSEISINLFTLSKILHGAKSPSHLFTMSKILHWAKSPSHLFTLSKILYWVKSPSHPSEITLSVIHSPAFWSTFFCIDIYWCIFTIACFSYALYIHALSSFGLYAVEHLIDHTFISVFKVSFTAEQTVLLWCSCALVQCSMMCWFKGSVKWRALLWRLYQVLGCHLGLNWTICMLP